MTQASAVIPAVATVPGPGAPVSDLAASILDQWERMETAKIPPGLYPRGGLERFQRQIQERAYDIVTWLRQSSRGLNPTAVANNITTRADLLPLRAGHRIPLHDHPGSVVVIQLLTGRAIVGTYQVPREVRSGQVVSMRPTGQSLLNPGDFKLGLPGHDNAHKLSALIDALFLEVIVSPQRSSGHHRFFALQQRAAADGMLSSIAIGQPGSSPAAEPCNAMER
jgi:quercetin dioxygenase-like cupin family protein